MAHSNKPQPDYSLNLDGSNPYGSLEEQAAEYALNCFADPEYAARDELEIEAGARYDQYDGWDTGDLNNPAAWEEDELDAPAEAAPAAPVVAPLPPPVPVDEDDILF